MRSWLRNAYVSAPELIRGTLKDEPPAQSECGQDGADAQGNESFGWPV